VVYCSGQCQKDDWPYHKRICSKPAAPAPAPAPAAAPAAPAPGGGAPSADKPLVAKATTDVVGADDDGLDDEDRAAIEEVKRKGYRYFARKLNEEETKAIGDIRPKAVAVASAASAAPAAEAPPSAAATPGSPTAVINPTAAAATAAGASAAAAAGAGGPSTAASSSSSSAAAAAPSSWNKSGTTYEQRNHGDTVRARIKELLKERRAAGDLVVGPIPGVGRLVVTGISNWGESSADVIISRGKSKWIYDLSFKVVVQVLPEDAGREDIQEDMSDDTAAAAADKKSGGDGSGDGKKSDKDNGGDAAAKEKEKEEKGKKRPRALLFFKEVSNMTEADGAREVILEWGSPAPAESQREVIRTALAVDAGAAAGPTKVIRGVVEQSVLEFKAKQ
jgi:hypothetical protein